MILLIIFGVLFIPGLVFFILGMAGVWDSYDGDDASTIGGGVSGFIGLCGLLVCGILLLVAHNPVNRERIRIEYQEKILFINNTRKALENQLQSSTLTILEVSAYNDTVRDFKSSLRKEQVNLKSPWIGCLCCDVCNEFSVDAVSYLYVE